MENTYFNLHNGQVEKSTYWHTSSHILAQAVKRLFPTAKLGIGPAIDNGFYYDFDIQTPFTSEDLNKIQSEIKKIIKENLPIERFELPRTEALELMKDNPYKVELINDLPECESISFYKQGEFTDLCAGPQLASTGKIKALKLLSATAAYWKGDQNNKSLCRIYGISFPSKDELNDYVAKLEEAKSRDHNKLGRELGIFMTDEKIGQGLPILMPKGAKIMQTLQRFIEDEEQRRGYLPTKTPYMAKSDLYKVSGHWQHYKDGMFVLGDGDESEGQEVLALRPMTCPFQFAIYNAGLHSYRDLPVRYSETATLFRNESSGEMHGLIRVRQFTLSEGHLIVTPEQLEDEFAGVLDLIDYVMSAIGIKEDIWYRFSKWDANNKDKYVGTAEEWENAQILMKKIIDKMGIHYVEADGEAAFYGPKLDIQCRNVHGKEDTIITIQLDFALADRFDMTYVDADGVKKRPYIIHRSSIGCYERTLALLIEKYVGALPLWLAPTHAKILPISEKFNDYAKSVREKLTNAGLSVEVDERNEKLGKKIRDTQLQKIAYTLIVGEAEETNGTVSLRSRKEVQAALKAGADTQEAIAAGDLGSVSISDLIAKLTMEITTKEK